MAALHLPVDDVHAHSAADAEPIEAPRAPKSIPDILIAVNIAAHDVMKTLGTRAPAAAYRTTLAQELLCALNLPVREDVSMPVIVGGRHVYTANVDILVDGRVVLEISVVDRHVPAGCAASVQTTFYKTHGGYPATALVSFGKDGNANVTLPKSLQMPSTTVIPRGAESGLIECIIELAGPSILAAGGGGMEQQ